MSRTSLLPPEDVALRAQAADDWVDDALDFLGDTASGPNGAQVDPSDVEALLGAAAIVPLAQQVRQQPSGEFDVPLEPPARSTPDAAAADAAEDAKDSSVPRLLMSSKFWLWLAVLLLVAGLFVVFLHLAGVDLKLGLTPTQGPPGEPGPPGAAAPTTAPLPPAQLASVDVTDVDNFYDPGSLQFGLSGDLGVNVPAPPAASLQVAAQSAGTVLRLDDELGNVVLQVDSDGQQQQLDGRYVQDLSELNASFATGVNVLRRLTLPNDAFMTLESELTATDPTDRWSVQRIDTVERVAGGVPVLTAGGADISFNPSLRFNVSISGNDVVWTWTGATTPVAVVGTLRIAVHSREEPIVLVAGP